jgi:glucose-6-phosphate isomerase
MLHIRLTKAEKVHYENRQNQLEAAWEELCAGAESGTSGFGWMNLPERNIDEIKKMGRELAAFRYIILIGIGGSALGLQMLENAFLDPAYPYAGENDRPRLFTADNADADSNESIWRQVRAEETALLVVSKSGRTLETLSNFLYFREKLYSAIGAETERHIFTVTSPSTGFLHKYAAAEGTRSIDFPEDTGGRYSVLSSCGLAAAAALGIDVDKLLAGASAMKKSLLASPCSSVASAMASDIISCYESGRNVTVFWSYGDHLKAVSEWFAQLWGESLGKDGRGMTPQSALGSIDQHSQLQLYTSGPADKYFIFLSKKPAGKFTLSIPEEPIFDEASYLNGVSPENILECERRGVAAALKRRGLPMCEICLDAVDEYCLGGLIFLLETVTALMGFMLGVNPFDQTGVEEGKNYALALCGSASYTKYLDVLREIDSKTASSDFTV